MLAHTEVKSLQNFPLSLQTNAILFIYFFHMDLLPFGRQGKFLLFCVVAMLEPVIPSLNHITKLAQMRKKNEMQTSG